MQFGIFSNGERSNRIAADTYDEDLREIELVDELGFREAWVSEHIARTDAHNVDNVAAADLFIMKAAAATKQIKLGPAIRPIALYQPVQVAVEAAMCDHLMRGRYMFGFGVGGPIANGFAQRGLGDSSDEIRRERAHEAWSLIRKCWMSEEPFDYDGKYYHGQGIRAAPRPYTKPYMDTGIAVSSNVETARLAGEQGLLPLFSPFTSAAKIKGFSESYTAGAETARRVPHRGDFRVCKFVYVSESVAKAKEELRDSVTPYIERIKRDVPRYFREVPSPTGNVEDITWDVLVDCGYYFVGDPDGVTELIREYYDEAGGFGVLLLLMGKDYGTFDQRERSLRAFTEEVAPRLSALEPDRGAQPAGVS